MRRNALAMGSTLLVLWLFGACSGQEAVAPTPDPTPTHTYSNGEAIAVVKTWLSSVTLNTVSESCGGYIANQSPKWTETALESGVWEVRANSDRRDGEWKVVEGTNSVDVVEPFVRRDC